MVKEYDIVIVILPFNFKTPVVGPYHLKSYLEQNGFSCKIIDWNYKILEKHKELSEIQIQTKYIKDYFVTEYSREYLPLYLSEWIEEIKQYNPKWIGLSLNVYKFIKPLADYLIKPIKQNFPNSKIIAGGPIIGLEDLDFELELLNKNYVDYYVKGEGEDAILQILQTNTWDNNTPLKRIRELDNYPDPDYSDVLDYPDILNKNIIYPQQKFKFPIITTRGCVNNCNFCFNMYKGIYTRSPERVVDEMVNLYRIYGVYDFIFADSLSNTISNFLIDICNLIIDKKNMNELPEYLTWSCDGYCFPVRYNDSIMYQKMGESGCISINIGIESGSYKIRNDMNKKILEEDFIYMYDQLSKNNITSICNIIMGYYTETENDFQETIDLIIKCNNIGKKIIINTGSMFQILANKKWENIGFKLDDNGEWYYGENTFLVRIKRFIKLNQVCKQLGIKCYYSYYLILYEKLLKYNNELLISEYRETFNI